MRLVLNAIRRSIGDGGPVFSHAQSALLPTIVPLPAQFLFREMPNRPLTPRRVGTLFPQLANFQIQTPVLESPTLFATPLRRYRTGRDLDSATPNRASFAPIRHSRMSNRRCVVAGRAATARRPPRSPPV